MTAAPTTPTDRVATGLLRVDPRRKLLPLAFFCVMTGLDTSAAMDLVEDGRLFPAFNIARVATGKREVRVWRGAIESWRPDGPPPPRPALESVIGASLPILGVAPASNVTIVGIDLVRRWSVGRLFICRLIDAGELREVGRHGNNESPRISYASAAKFLERRAI